jgi:PAS domain-containing protein
MAFGPVPGSSEFAEFVETVRDHRDRTAEQVRIALTRVADQHPDVRDTEVADALRGFERTLRDLDAATEELQLQTEALFAARVDLDDTSAFYHALFEFAPCAYLVTTREASITYANEAASLLLGRSRNALVGKPHECFVPCEERRAFRDAVARSGDVTGPVSTWPLVLSPSSASARVQCRARVRSVVLDSLATARTLLFWTITEETDEDLF